MKKLLILLIVLIVLIFLALSFQKSASKSVEIPVTPTSSPTPKSSEVRSLEGDHKLNMTAVLNANGTTQYNFSVTNSLGKKQLIFSKTVGKGVVMALPQNSWSPTNKYIFIEDREAGLINYLVFKTNGETFPDGQQYLNVTSLFNSKVKNYSLKAITGWDDPVLMHVITNGPRFWFDLTTQSFIQLVR